MVIQYGERCIQDVYTSILLLNEIHIFLSFWSASEIYGYTVRGTVYTKCVYIVPVVELETYFPEFLGLLLQLMVIQ